MRFFVLAAIILVLFSIQSPAQGGWSFEKANTNGDLVAVYFTSATRGFIAGDDGFLASTDDGGRTWNKYPLPADASINEIYFRNDDNGYLVAGRRMFITHDGGRSWNETRIFRSGEFGRDTPEFLSIRFSDKKRGYVIGSVLRPTRDDMVVVDSLLMRTDDGGDTWRRILVPTKIELFHLDFNGSSHGWIVGDKGVVLATRDSGETWQMQQSGVTRALYNVDFRDDNDGYAVGGGGTIIRTSDGGMTWRKVETSFKETFMRVDFADDKNGWIVGHKGAILRSSDRGATWVLQESGTNKDLYGLFMTKKYGLAVGAAGTIITYKP